VKFGTAFALSALSCTIGDSEIETKRFYFEGIEGSGVCIYQTVSVVAGGRALSRPDVGFGRGAALTADRRGCCRRTHDKATLLSPTHTMAIQ
jgi:hypothetical protein